MVPVESRLDLEDPPRRCDDLVLTPFPQRDAAAREAINVKALEGLVLQGERVGPRILRDDLNLPL